MPPRSIKAETCAAVICSILGAKVDPALTWWIFNVVDVLSCALAAIAFYFVLLLALDLADEGVGAFRARAAAAFRRPPLSALRPRPRPRPARRRRPAGHHRPGAAG